MEASIIWGNAFTCASSTNDQRIKCLTMMEEYSREFLTGCQCDDIDKSKVPANMLMAKVAGEKSVDRTKARTLREQGMSFRKIAEQLGCILSSVQRVIYGEAQ